MTNSSFIEQMVNISKILEEGRFSHKVYANWTTS